MHLTSGYEHRGARIEIVPLLDVVFLLLVAFIYAMLSVTVHHEVHVVLPSSAQAPRSAEDQAFAITLTAENRIIVQDVEMTLEEAVRHAVERPKSQNARVLIHGDRGADLGIAVELLSKLKNADIDSVSFLVQEGK